MDPLEQARALFLQALAHHDGNRLREAEQLYRQALALAPDRTSILTNLSAILIATDRPAQALPLCKRVLELEPGNPVALEHLRNCAQAAAPAKERCRQLEARLAQSPDDVHLLNAHALALIDAGHPGTAVHALERAVALDSGNAGLRLNLALAAEAQGQKHAAMSHYVAALNLRPGLEAAGQAFVRLLLEVGPPIDLPRQELEGLLVRALRTPWMRPQSLVAMVTHRLQGKAAVQACMQRIGKTPHVPGSQGGMDSGQRELAREPLLLALLECALVADPVLERILTACRAALLESVAETAAEGCAGVEADAGLLAFATSLAGQCFHNGYAYAISPRESDQLAVLSAHVEGQLDRGTRPQPLPLAVLGCYLPLLQLQGSQRLLEPDARARLPPPLLRRQIEQPLAEIELRTRLEVLTPVQDKISRKVQAQYEEHPYPRWTGLPRHTHKVPLARFIEKHVAGVEGLELPQGEGGRYRVLNAGCGTGQHPVDLMLRVDDLDMLAVDLSRTSLGYASRMAAALGMEGIRFAQADILELASLGRQFDLIDCAGVLHHLETPERGLAVLRQLLVPKGILRIALYSERARQCVVACRDQIAEFGYPATDEGIRYLRQHVLGLPPTHPASGVARFSDFYSLQECRDLVFHEQEHRFTLVGIGALLERQRLGLLGLQLLPGQQAMFEAHHGDGAQLRSLSQWDAFEQACPDTFADMFVLWVQAHG